MALLLLLSLLLFLESSCKSLNGGGGSGDSSSIRETGVDTLSWANHPNAAPPITDGKDSEVLLPPVTPPNPDPRPNPTPPPKPNEPDPEPNPIEPNIPGSFDIAYLLPFNAHLSSGGTISSKASIKSLEFYQGAKMALDKLSAEGMNVRVHTFDSQGSSSQTTSLMHSQLTGMDIIFGPMKAQPIAAVAQAVKGSQTILVSPWNPKTHITSDNPNYVQVSPSLQTHCEALMKHVRLHHNMNNVVLACRQDSDEASYFAYLQEANMMYAGSASVPRLPELQAQFGNEIPLQSYLRPDSTIFIIPSWKDEPFISNFLRKLAVEKGNRKIVVYGLPQWMDFERIDFDYYERLNVRVSSPLFVNKEDSDVFNFRRDYYNRTGTVPTDDAFLGYDLTLFFGRQLLEHGPQFIKKLDGTQTRNGEYYHTNFRFQAEYPAGDDSFSKIKRFENKYLNILHFNDFKFRKGN